MSKNIKDTLLSTLIHGDEILTDIAVLRRVKNDPINHVNEADVIVNQLHKKSMQLVVNEKIDTHKNAVILRLVNPDGYLPPFEAGQYINIFTEIDGVRTSRPYSISSSPKQKAYYEITVAKIKRGFVSDYLINDVKVGDILEVNGPQGVFRYQPVFHSDNVLFLAGGSGITPFMSMLKEGLDSNQKRDFVLLYGCNSLDSALYHDELQDYASKHPNFKYHLVLTNKQDGWDGETGYLNKELITRLVPDIDKRTCYICGPQVMNSFCVSELQALNTPIKRIRREMFGASQEIEKEPGWPENVQPTATFTIKIGDQSIQAFANESILCSLERNKIRVNVCCRSGECSLCRVKLVSGKVYLAKGMMLRKADEKFGYIHSCKAYPISDIEIQL